MNVTPTAIADVLVVELRDVEIPPFSAFLAEATRRSIKTVDRGES